MTQTLTPNEAIIVRFKEYCDENGIGLPDRNFTIGDGLYFQFVQTAELGNLLKCQCGIFN